MKKSIIAFSVLLILSSCSSSDKSGPPNDSIKKVDSTSTTKNFDTPEEVASAIVACISKNDYPALCNMVVTREEMTNLINGSAMTDERKKSAIVDIDRDLKRFLSDNKRGFDQIRSFGEKDGIIWNEAKYKRSEFTMKNEKGLTTMDLKIFVDFKGVEYPIKDNLVKSATGWKLLNGMSYGNEDEMDEMDEMMKKMLDSLIQDSIDIANRRR